jgi:hypothetical protein
VLGGGAFSGGAQHGFAVLGGGAWFFRWLSVKIGSSERVKSLQIKNPDMLGFLFGDSKASQLLGLRGT